MSSGLVIGTAGHIDHGKTSLVRALTGMDTDRLAEEKRRGISIDLGFAHLILPDGARLSFVDVPGHERFIRNMLAGAAGIEAVVLVIAADESVKPQTREHFDICRLLDISQGVIALTKADLATPAQLAKAAADAMHLTQGSFLAGAPVIPVSAVTGLGLDELTRHLAALAARTSRRDTRGLARLPIDRSFAVKGFGTIVTGTLWSGSLHVGDTIRIHPTNREARIRGLQRHGEPVETALAGERTAVNLAGIDYRDIKRGFALTSLSALETTSTMDVALEWLNSLIVPTKATDFLLDIGTAELPATLRPLCAGASFARLHLSEPVLALPGDRFVLRRPSPALTVAGGTVADSFPPIRLNKARTLERLSKLVSASPVRRVEILTEESSTGISVARAVQFTGLSPDLIAQTQNLVLINGQHLVSKQWIEQRRQELLKWLEVFHAKNPRAPGAPVSQARLGLELALLGPVLDGFRAICVQGDLVFLANHRARVSDVESKALAQIEFAFRKAAFEPPAADDLLATIGAEPKMARGLLDSLLKDGKLIRISAGLIFHADVITHLRGSLAAHKGRRFSVPDFKAWTNISRKYAIPLLEYLDHQRVTKRDGDSRVVL